VSRLRDLFFCPPPEGASPALPRQRRQPGDFFPSSDAVSHLDGGATDAQQIPAWAVWAGALVVLAIVGIRVAYFALRTRTTEKYRVCVAAGDSRAVADFLARC
jgi:hypothetical protein